MINGKILLAIGKRIAGETGMSLESVIRFNNDYVFRFEGDEIVEAKLEKNLEYIKFGCWDWSNRSSTFEAKYDLSDKNLKNFVKITRIFLMERKLRRD
jgi:hypothetical protein